MATSQEVTFQDRLDEAQKAIEEAQKHNLEAISCTSAIYRLAFLKGDAAEMGRQVAWAAGKPGSEDLLLSFQSDTEAYYGRLARARDFSRRAVDAAVRERLQGNSRHLAGQCAACGRRSLVTRKRRSRSRRCPRTGPGRDVKMFAALPWRGVAKRPGQNDRGGTRKELSVANRVKGLLAAGHQGALNSRPTILPSRLVFSRPPRPYELAQPPSSGMGTALSRVYLAARRI